MGAGCARMCVIRKGQQMANDEERKEQGMAQYPVRERVNPEKFDCWTCAFDQSLCARNCALGHTKAVRHHAEVTAQGYGHASVPRPGHL